MMAGPSASPLINIAPRSTRMFQMPNTLIDWLRLVGKIEAVSLLVLLLIAMPLKYAAGYPEAVRVVGMAHGILWLVFLVFLALSLPQIGWRMGLLAFIASVLPAGPFAIDDKLKVAEAPGAASS